MNEYKCNGCGAIITSDEVSCSYCGTENKHYVESNINGSQNNTNKTNRRCGNGFFYSLIGIFIPVFIILPVVSISNCIIGLTEIRETHEKGKGIAIIGIILGLASLLYQCIFIAIAITAFGYII